jgi:hypothetical protein
MTRLKNILSHKLNVGHFSLVLLLISGLTIGLYVFSLLLGWLCCMEPPAGPRMYSNWTLFVLTTVDLMILMLSLFVLFRNAVKKERFDFQKSYLIVAIILIMVYLIFIPYILIKNC